MRDDDERDAEEREPRRFSLADALGREAGRELLGGASPVDPRQQAAMAVTQLLERYLDDADGALRAVLARRVGDGLDILADRFADPADALRHHVARVLASDRARRELVREADVEWGRRYGEKPRFADEIDDPYTGTGVTVALERLLARINAEAD